MDQVLVGVEIGELERDDWIARAQPLDLLVHRYCFEIELLCAVVLGDAFEALDGFFFFIRAHIKIAQHVQGSEIVSVVIDDLPILLDCSVELPL